MDPLYEYIFRAMVEQRVVDQYNDGMTAHEIADGFTPAGMVIPGMLNLVNKVLAREELAASLSVTKDGGHLKVRLVSKSG